MKKPTYTPHPIDVTDITLSEDILHLSEQIAENVHEVWAAGRLADGWSWGAERNDANKEHPCLVPYDELEEAEKEYDRNTAMQTLKLIQKLGFIIKKKQE